MRLNRREEPTPEATAAGQGQGRLARRAVLLTVGLCVGLAMLEHRGIASPKAPAAAPADLVVHEWGTFTSMQGANGTVLEGLHHEEEALPTFVHNLHSGPSPELVVGKGGVRAVRVTQKMETPVLYFYSEKAMDVDVHVTFREGIVSEWFPAAASHEASYAHGALVDMGDVKQSSILWKLGLIPRGSTPPKGIPQVDATDPWAFARDVGAAYVKNRGDDEAEHYVFYRGLGKAQLPVRMETGRSGEPIVVNGGTATMPAAFLLEYGPGGARWTPVGALAGGSSRPVSLGGIKMRDGAAVVAELQAQIERALVDSGLYRDEARAMVRTWSRSWFASEGTRLIYLLPRTLTDNLLPIRITPTPSSLVRTLVGRLEYITPAVAAEVETAVVDRYSSNVGRRQAAVARLKRLGRFVEPHLRYLIATSSSKLALGNAQRLLGETTSPEPLGVTP